MLRISLDLGRLAVANELWKSAIDLRQTVPADLLHGSPDELVAEVALWVTAIRDQLDTLLDQAGRAELNLREALTMLCTAEVARKDERCIQMGMSIAKFPCVRTLEGFEYDAQPSVDAKKIRELFACTLREIVSTRSTGYP